MRPRNAARTGAGNAPLAERRADIFLRAESRIGNADRRGDREDAEQPLCRVSGDEDREGRIRRGHARIRRVPEPAASDDWRNWTRRSQGCIANIEPEPRG